MLHECEFADCAEGQPSLKAIQCHVACVTVESESRAVLVRKKGVVRIGLTSCAELDTTCPVQSHASCIESSDTPS